MRTVTRPAVLLAGVIALGACSAPEAGVEARSAAPIAVVAPPVTDAPTGTTTPSAPPTETPAESTVPVQVTVPVESVTPFELDPDKPPQPYDDYLATALADIQAFWRATFPQVYGSELVELTGGIYPMYPGKQGVPGCGEPETTYEAIRGNAFYCFDGDFIAYDDTDLLPSLYDNLGEVVIGVVMAHEFGHAIQQRIGYQDATIYMEQQADCFAGGWIAHIARGENPDIAFADSELKGALNGMIQVRDAPGTGLNDPAAHGTAFDRVGAFQDGFINGVAQCATYPQNPPALFAFDYNEFFQEDAPFADPGNGSDIFNLVAGELNVFWPERITGMPQLGVSVNTGDLDDACPNLPDDRSAPVARFCPDQQQVVIDVDLARQLYDVFGDFAVGYLLSAAWAEAVQVQIGSPLAGEDRALANDCLVGAFARSALPAEVNPNRSATQTELSPGDLDEAVLTAVALGDDSTDTNRFGSPFEKIDAFRSGVLGDVAACQSRFGL